jgi:hypothetical protein
VASRQSLVSVNRMIRAGGLDEAGVDAAVIEQARNLARMIDKVGPENAPLNLHRLYDSALNKLQRAVDRTAAAKRGRDRGETPVVEEPSGPPTLTVVEESPLEKLRREKQQRSA